MLGTVDDDRERLDSSRRAEESALGVPVRWFLDEGGLCSRAADGEPGPRVELARPGFSSGGWP
jgi:hypothetical protein